MVAAAWGWLGGGLGAALRCGPGSAIALKWQWEALLQVQVGVVRSPVRSATDRHAPARASVLGLLVARDGAGRAAVVAWVGFVAL